MLRKKGLIILGAIAALSVAISVLISDAWVERRIESFGSSIVGAKVELTGMRFSLLKLHVQWRGLQVADPDNGWFNLFETGHCNFKIDPAPLFARKVIIEDVQVQELRFNTERNTDGSLPARKKADPGEPPEIIQKMKQNLKAELERMPVFNSSEYVFSIDPESLWEKLSPKSPERIRGLVEGYEQKFSRWEREIPNLQEQEDLEALTARLQAIDVKKSSTPVELQQNLRTVNEVSKILDGLRNEYQKLRTEFERDVEDLQRAESTIILWIEDDLNSAFDSVAPPAISNRNVAMWIFGERITSRVEKFVGFVGKVRTYSEKARRFIPRKEKTPRLRGQTIRFEDNNPLPNFWIKQIALSGVSATGIRMEGAIENIVTQQDIIDRATTLKVSGEGKGGSGLLFAGSIDHRGEKPKELFTLEMQGFSLEGTDFSPFPLLPSKFSGGEGRLSATVAFEGSDLRTAVNFWGSGLRFAPEEHDAAVSPALNLLRSELADSIQDLSVAVTVIQNPAEFRLKLSSSIDELVVGRAIHLMREEREKAREVLEEKLKEKTSEYTGTLEEMKVKRVGELANEFEDIDLSIKSVRELALQKQQEIEERARILLKEKQDTAGEKLRKQLLNLGQ